MRWTPEENTLNFPPAQAWNDHPFRRPTTYCELLNQRQERQGRTLTGGHPRLDGVNTSTPEDSVCPRRHGKESAGSRSGRAKTVAWADEELHRTAQATKVRSRTPMEDLGGSAATNMQSAAEKAEAAVAAALALRTAAAAQKRVERAAWACHHKHVHVHVPPKRASTRHSCGRVPGSTQPVVAEPPSDAGGPSHEATLAEAVRPAYRQAQVASVEVQTAPVEVRGAAAAERAARTRDVREAQLRRLYDELARSDGQWRDMVGLLEGQLDDSRRQAPPRRHAPPRQTQPPAHPHPATPRHPPTLTHGVQVKVLEALSRTREPREPRGGLGAPSADEIAEARYAAQELAGQLARAEAAGAEAARAELAGVQPSWSEPSWAPPAWSEPAWAQPGAAVRAPLAAAAEAAAAEPLPPRLYPAPQRLCAWGTSASTVPPRW